MKKYLFTESQVKKILDKVIEEQYSNDGSVEDMYWAQVGLNKYLKSKGKSPIPADGAWGPKSEEAAMMFQKEHGLMVDGLMGCCTAKKLIELGFLDHDLWGKILKFFGGDPCRCNN